MGHMTSSRFVLSKQPSAKSPKWKMALGFFAHTLNTIGSLNFIQEMVLFLLAWTIIFPMLAYAGMLLQVVRKIAQWRLKKDLLPNGPISDETSIGKRNWFGINEMITFVCFQSAKRDFLTLKDDFQRNILTDALKMRINFKYGVTYWTEDRDFCFERHFIESSGMRKSGESITEDNFKDYLGEIKTGQKLFPIDKPPWQAVVVHLKHSERCAIVFHLHQLLFREHPVLGKMIQSNFEVDGDRYALCLEKIAGIKDNFARYIEPALKIINSLKFKFPHFHFALVLNKRQMLLLWSHLKLMAHVFVSFFRVPKILFTEIFTRLWERKNPLKLSRTSMFPRRLPKDDGIEVSWSESVPCHLVEMIAQQSNTTFQDVVVSCCSGAIHHYLAKYYNNSPEDILALVSIPIFPWFEASNSKNSNVTIKMATSSSDCCDRLSRTNHSMEDLKKRVLSILGAGWLLHPNTLNNFLPHFIVDIFLRLLHRKHAVSISMNELKDGKTGHFGSDIEHVLYWNHHRKQIGLHLSAVKTKDSLTLCIESNVSKAPEPEMIATSFIREINELAMRFGIQKPRSPSASPRPTTRLRTFF